MLVKVDVSLSSEVATVVDLIVQRLASPMSILVNCAGDMVETAPVEQMNGEL